MNTTIFLRRRATRRMSGWSLIELTIILVVLAILCAILAPVIGRFIRNARIIRCREDVQAIGCAIWMMIEDTGIGYLRYNGRQRNDCHIILAVGDGHIPVLGSGGDSRWTAPVDLERKDFLEYHLVLNQPGANTNRRYYTPLDLGFNSEFGWRGPYITAPIDPDPWGNRYAVNCEYLGPFNNTEDTFVISAGPNGAISTPWAIDGVTPGDDDILYVVDGSAMP